MARILDFSRVEYCGHITGGRERCLHVIAEDGDDSLRRAFNKGHVSQLHARCLTKCRKAEMPDRADSSGSRSDFPGIRLGVFYEVTQSLPWRVRMDGNREIIFGKDCNGIEVLVINFSFGGYESIYR